MMNSINPLGGGGRVFGVAFPFERVAFDVSVDAMVVVIIADDVFVVIALPDWGAG
jgi:hypothetical protein